MNKYLLTLVFTLSFVVIALSAYIFVANYSYLFKAEEEVVTNDTFIITDTPVVREQVLESLSSFIKNSITLEGAFASRYRCEGNSCESQSEQLEDFVGYPIKAILLTEGVDSVDFKKGIERVTEECRVNIEVCSNNISALYAVYKITGEESYKNFILELAPSIEKEVNEFSFENLIDNNVLRKIEILYDVTGNEKYKKIIVETADKIVSEWPDKLSGAVMYQSGTYQVTFDMPLLISGVLIPAYKLTNDEKYIAIVKEFYLKADLADNINFLAKQGEVGTIALLNAVEGLSFLYLDGITSEVDRNLLKEEAYLIMNRLIGWYYDVPERVIYNGDGGMLTGFVRGVMDPTGVNYKRVALAGWFVVLLEEPVFINSVFYLYSRNDSI